MTVYKVCWNLSDLSFVIREPACERSSSMLSNRDNQKHDISNIASVGLERLIDESMRSIQELI